MSVIANTTVLSNFASIGQLDLLRQLFTTLYLSTEVYAEVQEGIDEGYSFYADVSPSIYPFADRGWLHLTSVAGDEELRLFGAMPAYLHRGEASSIAIARIRGWQFLTDDLAARRYALKLGVQVSGTLGCLVLAVEVGLYGLDEANAWLGLLIRSGFRSPVLELTQLLQYPPQ
jgi:predicted nucleic acid-binding protein